MHLETEMPLLTWEGREVQCPDHQLLEQVARRGFSLLPVVVCEQALSLPSHSLRAAWPYVGSKSYR